MLATTAEDIKRLREETSCGVIDCKKALEEAKGDFNKAKDLLRKRGLEMASKKSDRVAKEGRVESYIHSGSKIGVLVEVNCETDFVAKNDDFTKFTRDLAMHIAAMAPADVAALLEQPFVRESSKSIKDMLNELVAKIGENIIISRFIRFKVGE